MLFSFTTKPVTAKATSTLLLSVRTIIQIPHWEHHIRFDPAKGRKRPAQDVLDRFKRLNNGSFVIQFLKFICKCYRNVDSCSPRSK